MKNVDFTQDFTGTLSKDEATEFLEQDLFQNPQ